MQYRPHRYPTDCSVNVSTPDGPHCAHVVDVSRTGARLSGLDGLQRGDKVRIDVLSHKVDAVVLWARSGNAGITFRPAISDHLVDVLRKRVDGRRQHPSTHPGFRYAEMR